MPRRPSNADNPTQPHKLTVASVALLPTTGAQYRVRDAGTGALPGFAVQVSRDGSKAFTLDYRIRGDRTSYRMTFGRFPGQSPDAARVLARVAKERAMSGSDPRADERATAAARRLERETARAAARERKALAALTVERIARDYVTGRRPDLKPTTASLYDTTIKRYLTGTFGATPIALLTDTDVRALLRTVQGGALPDGVVTAPRYAKKMGGNGAARTLRRFLATVWRYAADERRIVTGASPVPAASKIGLAETPTERFLTPEECRRVLETLDTAERVGLPPAPHRARVRKDGETAKHRPSVGVDTPIQANPVAVAAVRFALLTGWRHTEVLTLQWSMLRPDLRVVILPETKSGESTRAPSPAAWAILDALPKVVGVPWCFPSPRKPKTHLRTVSRLWDAVRHAAGISARFHDMRHTAASLAINAGASLEEVQSMLGHQSARSTARYAKLIPTTGLRAAERVAAALAAAAATPPATVTPIDSKRKRA